MKPDLSYISFCPLRILYNNKFILMATSLGTNAVILIGIHYVYLSTRPKKKIIRFSDTFFKKQMHADGFLFITETLLFKYTENFTTEKLKIFRQKIQIFFIFLLKT